MRDDEDSTGDDSPLPPLPIDPDVEVSDSAARWDILLVIAAGGALGSLARWGLGEALGSGRNGFPWATFLENVSGGFALGVLMVLVIDVWSPSRYVRPFLGVGVLGGYTTFSTYALDTRNLIAADHAPLAAVYFFGTLAVGLAGVWVGIAATRAYAVRSRGKGRSA